MLAGVLFGLCLAPVKALVATPAAAAVVIAVWLVVLRYRRAYATPAAALTAALVIAYDAPGLALDAVADRADAAFSSCRSSRWRRSRASRCRCSSSRWRRRTCRASRC